MASTSVKQPYPIFGDVDGNPLESGYIYIGTINLDPETNPITVYWDAALTLVAAQPIRTVGGYPSNNGTPGALFAGSDFSITIRDKNGSLVTNPSTSTTEIGVATSTKIGGVLSGTDISVDATGNVTVVNDSHTHDTQYYPIADIDSSVAERRQLYAKETVTYNVIADTDYTLTSAQNLFGRINITDSGVLLTVTRNINVDTSIRDFVAINSTLQSLVFKTSAGTGVTVPAGGITYIYCDGNNVVASPQSGSLLQSKASYTGTVATGTALIPFDDTIPQNTEGTEFFTITITPKQIGSKILIAANASYQTSVDTGAILAIFKSDVANALGVSSNQARSTAPAHIDSFAEFTTASLSPITFTARMSGFIASTITVNGTAGARLFGGVYTSGISITEIAK